MSISMNQTLRAGCVVAIVVAAQFGWAPLVHAQSPTASKVPPQPSSDLGPIPADLDAPSDTSGDTVRLELSQLTADQRAAFDAAMEVLEEQGVKATDGTGLHRRVRQWITLGKLTFGKVPDNDNACYGQGEMTILSSIADDIAAKSTEPMNRRIHVVGLAQTLVHEFHHEHQEQGDPKNPRDPASKECETEAWTAALNEAERWVIQSTPKSMTGATSEQLDTLRAVTRGWIEYNTFYNNKIDKKLIFERRSYSDASGKPISVKDRINQMDDLRRRADEMRDMLSVLESIAGVQPGSETSDQLIDKIPDTVTTRTELEKFVKALAEKAVSREHRLSPWQMRRKELILNQLLKTYPRIERSWRKRRLPKVLREKFVAVAAKLSSVKLSLSYTPNPAVIDPSQGTDVAVKVAVDSQAVDVVLQELRSVIRTGRGTPAVSIVDAWTQLPEGTDGNYVFSEPKEEEIKLVRTVNIVSKGSLYDKLFNKAFTVEGATTVKVEKIEFPRSIAGQWKGALVVLTIPGLAGVGPGAVGGSDIDQACAAMYRQIANLRGKALPLTTTIVPASFVSGRLTLSVTPPTAFSPGPPIQCTYRYLNGEIKASGTQGKAQVSFAGNLLPAPGGGWMIKGTWEAVSLDKKDPPGTKVLTGSWSGRNPHAK